MIYGFKNGETTVAAAGTSVIELEGFYQHLAESDGNPGFIDHRITTFMDHLSEASFKGFKHPVYVFTHADAGQQEAFIAANQIAVHGRNFCVDRHTDMLRETTKDPYAADDGRTIAQLNDLTDETDRWDKRSDEQREADKKYKEIAKEAKARGDLSGDSFDPNQGTDKKGEVHVTDVRVHRDADGEIVIDNVLGVKGLHEGGTEIDHEAAERMAAERQAEKAAALAAPRPWHDGTLVNLSDAERADLPKQFKGDEFIMCGDHSYERGTYITITPKTYFEAHGKPWDGKLDIGHLLPADVKEVGDGLYHTKSRNWLEISHALNELGFRESLMLQLWLNNQ